MLQWLMTGLGLRVGSPWLCPVLCNLQLNGPCLQCGSELKAKFRAAIESAETRAAEQLNVYAPEVFAEVRDARAERVFTRARSVIDASLVTVEEKVLDGEPAASILAHAAGEARPMIVIGSRGLSPVSRLLVGSVSQRVLSQAACPVTIVHR